MFVALISSLDRTHLVVSFNGAKQYLNLVSHLSTQDPSPIMGGMNLSQQELGDILHPPHLLSSLV